VIQNQDGASSHVQRLLGAPCVECHLLIQLGCK
jgi:hypothetical protein